MKHYFIGLVFSSLLIFWIIGPSSPQVHSQDTTSNSSLAEDTTATTSITENFGSKATPLSQEQSTSTVSVRHISTPEQVKAIYISSWVASTPSLRTKIVDLITTTELNTIVIDIKDNTGVVTWNGRMKEEDLQAFIEELHDHSVYVIGRIAVFQDPLYATLHKNQSVQKPDGTLWKSKKGEAWVDTGSLAMWSHVVDIGKKAYSLGVDEVNLDYIRFSTEGVHDGLIFPESGIRAKTDRVGVVTQFYAYVTGKFREQGIPVSGDVFGIITTSTADIPVLGQDLHQALTYFDYVAPMVYPSHYAPGTFGLTKPAIYPRKVIYESMKGALQIADEVASSTGKATSTIRGKLRPWYQDFDMGAIYTASMVRDQIEAGYDLGINSWMLWDPSNKYTKEALQKAID